MGLGRVGVSERLVLIGMVSLGILISGTTVLEALFRPNPASPLFIAGVASSVPFLGMLFGSVYWLRVSDFPTERYERIGELSLVGTAGFLILFGVFGWMIFDTGWNQIAMARWGTAVGAGGSAVVGVLEARAFDEALRTEGITREAADHRRQRELLDYLNALLRHEVLNSVTVIWGYADRLEENPGDASRVAECASIIRREADELKSITEDVRILLYAAEGARSFTAVDIVPVLEEEVGRIRDRQGRLDIDTVWPESVHVLGDDLLHRIFANLIQNAVEHNDSDSPWLGVEVRNSTDSVTIRVKDNGPGISPPEQDHLFDLTKKASQAHGLGLSIVQTLVDRYDGRVELSETGPEGSVFTIELPKAQHH